MEERMEIKQDPGRLGQGKGWEGKGGDSGTVQPYDLCFPLGSWVSLDKVALYLTAVRERSVRRSWEYPYLIFDIIAHIWF